MSNTRLKEDWGWLNKYWEPIGPYEIRLLFVGLAAFFILGGSTLGLCVLVFTGCASGVLPSRAAPWVLVFMAFLACAIIFYYGFGVPGPLTADLSLHQFNGRVHSNMNVFVATTVGLSYYAGSLAMKARVRQTASSVRAMVAVASVVVGAFAFYLPYTRAILDTEHMNIERLLDRYEDDMSELKSLVPDSRGSERQAVTDRFKADFFRRRYEGLDGDVPPPVPTPSAGLD